MVVFGDPLFDTLVVVGLLVVKLITREPVDLQALTMVVGVDLLELCIVYWGQTSERSNVNYEVGFVADFVAEAY